MWSDVLPRPCFVGAISQPKMERKRRSTNRWARSLSCRMTMVKVLHHPQFMWSHFHLFDYDGVHLSCEGLGLLRQNLQACIESYYS